MGTWKLLLSRWLIGLLLSSVVMMVVRKDTHIEECAWFVRGVG